ncbi:hypothetical protein BOO24_03510 [Vibrio navarrensis]|uniref:hypothetical protein n=1 Tax=Vibrio navarrensis TaxID=29495 RepID=UPI0018698C2C|nr:hypothetical protein [Vibrio navarrensis]MBE4591428.1 hypothetical protein [Vibrio navarrensis]
MKFCILAKDDVFIVENIENLKTERIVFSLFTQGFVLIPMIIEAPNAENALLVYQNRFRYQDLCDTIKSMSIIHA